MKIITELEQIKTRGKTAVAIGKFDGVHRGHRELLRRILAQKEKGMDSVVLTFAPAPEVFFGFGDKKELTPREEKEELFARMGVDILVYFPMNPQTAAISPENFIQDILVKGLHMGYLCAGLDLTFGDGGMGKGDLLERLSEKYRYEAEIIPKLTCGDREISSSLIREEVERGNLSLAARMLGRNYEIEGMVTEGKRLGRTIGCPTANLIPAAGKILPPCGVYYVRVQAGGHQYSGISNIGYKPTVSEEGMLGVETYLYGFAGNLYGEKIRVAFLEYKRAERKMSGIEELKAVMAQDIKDGEGYFAEREKQGEKEGKIFQVDK